MQQFKILLENGGFLLQSSSAVLVNSESMKNIASSMKKFADKWREKVERKMEFDLDLVQNEVLIAFSVRIIYLYVLLIKFANQD
jgi:hypothetical protein